ncbi:MAG TPA: hypothetical protein VMW76_02305 [Bacteroidales bacterium]|nr:hypothetical protein [Bacteroidales bacterium]
MKESWDNDNKMLEELLRSTGSEKAPAGFTCNVMSRIEVEPFYRPPLYSNPISRLFRVGSFIVFMILITAAIFSSGSANSQFMAPAFDWLGGLTNIPEMLSIPDISLPEKLRSLPYIVSAVLLLLILDGLFNKLTRITLKK